MEIEQFKCTDCKTEFQKQDAINAHKAWNKRFKEEWGSLPALYISGFAAEPQRDTPYGGKYRCPKCHSLGGVVTISGTAIPDNYL